MCCCGEGMCKKCSGMSKALLGVILLINAFVWPRWTGIDGWIAFGALLLVFAGVIKSFFPQGACCKDACAKNSCCSSQEPSEKVSHESTIVHAAPLVKKSKK